MFGKLFNPIQLVTPDMKVSVVIPALNEEIIIGNCLSAIRENDQSVELIVIDNGSTDRTVEIAKKYCDKVIIKPEFSLAQMRDHGANIATGDIIVTTDADCIPPRNWISQLIQPLKDPKVVAVGGTFRPLNKNLLSSFYCWVSVLTQKIFKLFQGANMAYKKEAFLKSKGYADAKRAEDWNLSWNFRQIGKLRFTRKAYTFTEIPLNRQFEYPGVFISIFLMILGGMLNWMNLVGFGVGYMSSEGYTFLVRHRTNLRRSHISLVALAVVYFLRRAIPIANFMFLVGLLSGVLGFHMINEELRFVIEDLKLYKTRKEPDNSLTGFIKQQLIRIIGI